MVNNMMDFQIKMMNAMMSHHTESKSQVQSQSHFVNTLQTPNNLL